jgi:hypothetical protein
MLSFDVCVTTSAAAAATTAAPLLHCRPVRRHRCWCRQIKVLRKASELRAANEALFFVQPTVLSLLVFGVHSAAMGNELTPANVFVTLALLNLTQASLPARRACGVRLLDGCAHVWRRRALVAASPSPCV